MRTTDCPADILLDPDFLVDFVVVVVADSVVVVVFPPAGDIVVVVCPADDEIVVVGVVVATVSTKIGVADFATLTTSQLLSQIDSPSVASLIPAIISVSATRPKLSVPLSSGSLQSSPPPFNPIKVFLQFNGQNVIVVLLNLKKKILLYKVSQKTGILVEITITTGCPTILFPLCFCYFLGF